jgi:tetratricopeptide (TPR) repeat protein
MPRKQSSKPPARRRRTPPQAPLNAALDPGSAPHRSALQRIREAQELIYDAWDSGDPRREVELAKEALRISPLCADAYVTLAVNAAPGAPQTLELWVRGVEAGQAALGAAFDDYVGRFWGHLETRPYMRARFGLAMALWDRGACQQAIAHARDMLRLNPKDNQGVRFALAAWLAGSEAEDDRGKSKIYRACGFVEWDWTAVLAAFRRGGDTPTSRQLRDSAARQYPAVLPYLTGAKRLPRVLPERESSDPEDEAMNYAADYGFAWHQTPGALAWLRGRAGPPLKPAPRGGRERRTVH